MSSAAMEPTAIAYDHQLLLVIVMRTPCRDGGGDGGSSPGCQLA